MPTENEEFEAFRADLDQWRDALGLDVASIQTARYHFARGVSPRTAAFDALESVIRFENMAARRA